MTLPPDAIAALLTDPRLPGEFSALCDCGGRQAGTDAERAALDLLRGLVPGVRSVPTPYTGWHATDVSLTSDGRAFPCQPLIRSVASDGIEAEVVHVGRGTEQEFAALGDALNGRVALVRHEYMFAAGHIHRRVKYAAALAAGAAGFLIAGPLPTGVVAGSSGRGDEPGIPAFGISPETAARLAGKRARMVLRTQEAPAVTETLLADIPGQTAAQVVLSAHLDGHDPAESAIDNATGVAVALAVQRALAPFADRFRRGLRLALFSVEEWALTGSRAWLGGLTNAERSAIALNVNIDSVGGAGALTALCSGFPALGTFVRRVSAEAGLPVGVYLPLMANSDHANFVRAGIPALRLMAGFDDPGSNLRHVLTPADTRDKVSVAELRVAALAAAALTWAALTEPDETIRALR